MDMQELEPLIGVLVRIVGSGLELVGVLIIVAGVIWAGGSYVLHTAARHDYETFKFRVGRALLLGLEVLVAADIVKTIAVEPNVKAFGVLAGLVLVRTFLSWSLLLEIEGRWPWQPHRT